MRRLDERPAAELEHWSVWLVSPRCWSCSNAENEAVVVSKGSSRLRRAVECRSSIAIASSSDVSIARGSSLGDGKLTWYAIYQLGASTMFASDSMPCNRNRFAVNVSEAAETPSVSCRFAASLALPLQPQMPNQKVVLVTGSSAGGIG